MLKVLVNAYACCPGMGSEQGMSWNFISRLAEVAEVFVITESEYEDINANLNVGENYKKYGVTKEQCERIHFYFVPVGETEDESVKIRKMCWNQGTWSFYPKYAKWQEKALDVARRLEDIDIMHQLNMAGFREPGMLYKINKEREKTGKKKIPLVWGPMTGYGSIPFSFMKPGGIKFTAFYLLKNTLNLLQLVGHHRVRKMIKSADKLIAATPEMKAGVEKFYGVDVEHINETGVNLASLEAKPMRSTDKSSSSFKLLWVGRFMYTKQLELALKTMKRLMDVRKDGLKNIELHIVGKGFMDSETENMHHLAEELGLTSNLMPNSTNVRPNIIWHGFIPNAEVLELMRDSDVFFFTSIFEATSTVILEAIQNNLPILCFDRCGFGPIVSSVATKTKKTITVEDGEAVGLKIPCNSPKQAINDFAECIVYMYDHPEVRMKMAKNCLAKAQTMSWERKIGRLMDIYEELMDKG